MHKYYTENKSENNDFSKKDSLTIFFILLLLFGIILCVKNLKSQTDITVIQPYYLDRYHKIPSKEARFGNKDYTSAISFLALDDQIRELKYQVRDLNKAINKHKAMGEIMSALKKVKKGKIEGININDLQQSILEAGYGNVEANLVKNALEDYKNQETQHKALKIKVEEESQKIVKTMGKDAKETGVFAMDIAKEIAEEKIQGFVDSLSIGARIGNFVINKVTE
ncbi:MAG: hypothetical protein GY793_00525 [Proteobacteria bacterium]|nr:hypothetical protein [Pseudomonadota bacterium]